MPKNDICKGLTFSDCELAILRQAVDKAEEQQGKRTANSQEVKKIISVVETFLRNKKLICYDVRHCLYLLHSFLRIFLALAI